MELVNPGIVHTQTHEYPVRRVTPAGRSLEERASVSSEYLMQVDIDGANAFQAVCSPDQPAELILGHLKTEGIIEDAREVASIVVEDDMRHAHVRTSRTAGAKERRTPLAPVTPIPWQDRWIFRLARIFAEDTPNHRKTFGAHSCYLAHESHVLYCCEDLGRHNALDKAVGCALRDGVDLAECILFSSGRMPEDMVAKVIRAGVPILATKAVPTEMGIKLARDFDLTLICSAHHDGMVVFNEPHANGSAPNAANSARNDIDEEAYRD